MRHRLAGAAVLAATGALVLGASAPAGASAAPTPAAQSAAAQLRAGTLDQSKSTYNICSAHHLSCQAIVVTNAQGDTRPMAFPPETGYGATELAKAYGLTDAPSADGTIVVIGAGAYPTLENDLAVYRSTYHLPPCTSASGCFTQLNYLGGAPYAPAHGLRNQFGEEEIGVETALDVEMASAACPGCKIISMQVPLNDGFYGPKQHIHNAIKHFAKGVQTAYALGAAAVSISYGYPTDSYSDTGTIAHLMRTPGMAIVSSSGDSGFMGRQGQWPQSLSTVVSAGGTSLYADSSNTRGYTEVAWNGAGSDCTPDVGPAVGQPPRISGYCHKRRAASDMSAVADPYTGVAVYDSYAPATGDPYGFIVVGGTSVASPFLGGLYARAPRRDDTLGPRTVYSAPVTAFHDVLIGTNAGLGNCGQQDPIPDVLCDSQPGWDGPTGRGTPDGLAPFTS